MRQLLSNRNMGIACASCLSLAALVFLHTRLEVAAQGLPEDIAYS